MRSRAPLTLAGLTMAISVWLYASPAYAALESAGLLDRATRHFHDSLTKWGTATTSAAMTLFWLFATAACAWELGNLAMRGGAMEDALAFLLRFAFIEGFWLFVLRNAELIGTVIINSLRKLGSTASGLSQDLMPSAILDVGFSILWKTIGFVLFTAPGAPIVAACALIMALIIVLAFAVVALNMLLLIVSQWFLLYGGIFFLGFAGAPSEAGIGKNYLYLSLSIGAQLFGMAGVVGLGQSFILEQYAQLSGDTSLGELAVILIVAIMVCMLSNEIPKLFTRFIPNSYASQGLGAASLLGATASAAAAVVAAGMMIKGAAASVTGVAKAAGAAHSAAKTQSQSTTPARAQTGVSSAGGGSISAARSTENGEPSGGARASTQTQGPLGTMLGNSGINPRNSSDGSDSSSSGARSGTSASNTNGQSSDEKKSGQSTQGREDGALGAGPRVQDPSRSAESAGIAPSDASSKTAATRGNTANPASSHGDAQSSQAESNTDIDARSDSAARAAGAGDTDTESASTQDAAQNADTRIGGSGSSEDGTADALSAENRADAAVTSDLASAADTTQATAAASTAAQSPTPSADTGAMPASSETGAAASAHDAGALTNTIAAGPNAPSAGHSSSSAASSADTRAATASAATTASTSPAAPSVEASRSGSGNAPSSAAISSNGSPSATSARAGAPAGAVASIGAAGESGSSSSASPANDGAGSSTAGSRSATSPSSGSEAASMPSSATSNGSGSAPPAASVSSNGSPSATSAVPGAPVGAPASGGAAGASGSSSYESSAGAGASAGSAGGSRSDTSPSSGPTSTLISAAKILGEQALEHQRGRLKQAHRNFMAQADRSTGGQIAQAIRTKYGLDKKAEDSANQNVDVPPQRRAETSASTADAPPTAASSSSEAPHTAPRDSSSSEPKHPTDWITGDDAMTEKQWFFLQRRLGDDADPNMTKAEASMLIDDILNDEGTYED